MSLPFVFNLPVIQIDASNGQPATGYLLHFLATGTNNYQNIYTDSTLGVALPNPISINSAGYPQTASGAITPIYMNGAYDIKLGLPTDSSPPASPIWSVTNITSATQVPTIHAISANYTTVASDNANVLTVNASSAPVTITLMNAVTAGNSYSVTVVKTDSSNNAVTINTTAGQTINGGSTYTITNQYSMMSFLVNAGNWIESLPVGISAGELTFTQATTPVNNINISNANTGSAPTISSVGTDTNIGIIIQSKGTGTAALEDGAGGLVLLGSSTSTGVELNNNQPILDNSGNAELSFTKTASAVNHLNVANAATGNAPVLSTVAGGGSNIGMVLSDSNGNAIETLASVASSVNNVQITNAVTTTNPTIAVIGSDTNVSLNLSGKGSGGVVCESPSGQTVLKMIPNSGSASNTISHTVASLSGNSTVTWPAQNVPNFYVQHKSAYINTTVSTTTTLATGTAPTTSNTVAITGCSISYTAQATTNKLCITGVANVSSSSTATAVGIFLFQGTTLLASWFSLAYAAGLGTDLGLAFEQTSGISTSAQTYALYFVSSAAGTTVINGSAGTTTQYWGGPVTGFTITEYTG